MDDDTLRRTRGVVSESATREMIDSALLARYSGSGPLPKATPVVARPQGSPAATPVGAAIAPGEARVVALLPLSGKYASYGQSSLAGIELALADANAKLVVRDSEGAIEYVRLDQADRGFRRHHAERLVEGKGGAR